MEAINLDAFEALPRVEALAKESDRLPGVIDAEAIGLFLTEM